MNSALVSLVIEGPSNVFPPRSFMKCWLAYKTVNYCSPFSSRIRLLEHGKPLFLSGLKLFDSD